MKAILFFCLLLISFCTFAQTQTNIRVIYMKMTNNHTIELSALNNGRTFSHIYSADSDKNTIDQIFNDEKLKQFLAR